MTVDRGAIECLRTKAIINSAIRAKATCHKTSNRRTDAKTCRIEVGTASWRRFREQTVELWQGQYEQIKEKVLFPLTPHAGILLRSTPLDCAATNAAANSKGNQRLKGLILFWKAISKKERSTETDTWRW